MLTADSLKCTMPIPVIVSSGALFSFQVAVAAGTLLVVPNLTVAVAEVLSGITRYHHVR